MNKAIILSFSYLSLSLLKGMEELDLDEAMGPETEPNRARIFSLLCLLVGLNLEDTSSPRASRLYIIIYCFICLASVYPVMILLQRDVTLGMSSATLALLIHVLASYLGMFFILKITSFNRLDLLGLLEGVTGQHWSRILAYLILNIPTLVLYTFFIAKKYTMSRYAEALGTSFLTYTVIVRLIFHVIFFEAAFIIEMRCKSLLEALNSEKMALNDLMKKKWLTRKAIADFNRIFAIPLAVMYSQVTSGCVVMVSSVVMVASVPVTLACVSSEVCLLITAYIVANRGSRLMTLLADIERCFLHRLNRADLQDRLAEHMHKQKWCCASIQMKVIGFDEKWDSLKVGCFVLSQRTFISYLATSVTCVAVGMQFDYKIVRMINDLAKRHGKDGLFKWY